MILAEFVTEQSRVRRTKCRHSASAVPSFNTNAVRTRLKSARKAKSPLKIYRCTLKRAVEGVRCDPQSEFRDRTTDAGGGAATASSGAEAVVAVLRADPGRIQARRLDPVTIV